MKLGDLIIQYRKENKLSQREFSRRCGLSNSLISIIEKGVNPQTGKPSMPDMATYNKLASAMGMSMQTLFTKLGNDASVQLAPASVRIQTVCTQSNHILLLCLRLQFECKNTAKSLQRNSFIGIEKGPGQIAQGVYHPFASSSAGGFCSLL